MATDDRRRDRYDQARRDFDELEVGEQASFLVEATASTLAQGLERAGQALAEGVERVVREVNRKGSSSRPAGESPGAAEPETAQQRASGEGRSTRPCGS